LAAKVELIINQGEDFLCYFKWTLVDGETAVDLTGFTWEGQIRATAQSTSTLAALTVTTVTAAEGLFSISLASTVTAELPTTGETYSDYSKYVYDVKATSSAGTVYRVLNGVVKVSPEVTK